MIGKTNVSYGRCKTGVFLGNQNRGYAERFITIPDIGFEVKRFWFEYVNGGYDDQSTFEGMWDIDATYHRVLGGFPPDTHGWIWSQGAARPLSLTNNINGSITIGCEPDYVIFDMFSYRWYALGD